MSVQSLVPVTLAKLDITANVVFTFACFSTAQGNVYLL